MLTKQNYNLILSCPCSNCKIHFLNVGYNRSKKEHTYLQVEFMCGASLMSIYLFDKQGTNTFYSYSIRKHCLLINGLDFDSMTQEDKIKIGKKIYEQYSQVKSN